MSTGTGIWRGERPGGPMTAADHLLTASPTRGTHAELSDGWARTERVVAIAALLALGFDRTIAFGIDTGLIASAILMPLWIGHLRRFAGVRVVSTMTVLAAVMGIVMTLATATHSKSSSNMLTNSLQLLSIVGGLGVILWARSRLTTGQIATWVGLGMVAGVDPNSALFASNPWRFGFSVAVTVLLLGLAAMTRRRSIEMLLVVVLIAVSAMTDARSSFAILLLTATLVAWQARPKLSSVRGSAARTVLALGVIAFAIYQIGQALILDGYLGESARERSVQQLDTSGSLIIGGRPEISATIALMRAFPLGFGSGVLPNSIEVGVAKQGLESINYDADNNGYVDRYMFGGGYELHSVIGDTWARYGLVGAALAALVAVLAVCRGAQLIAHRAASAVLVYVVIKTLWNLFFGPLSTSALLLTLALGLALPPAAARNQPPTGVGT